MRAKVSVVVKPRTQRLRAAKAQQYNSPGQSPWFRALATPAPKGRDRLCRHSDKDHQERFRPAGARDVVGADQGRRASRFAPGYYIVGPSGLKQTSDHKLSLLVKLPSCVQVVEIQNCVEHKEVAS